MAKPIVRMSAVGSETVSHPNVTFKDGRSFAPKPIIQDILRTKYCIPGSVVLVEGIEIIPVEDQKSRYGGRDHVAVRLLLGDGDLCIQALLARVMHSYLNRRGITKGAYVQLEKFELVELELNRKSKDTAKEDWTIKMPKRKKSNMVYLVVENLRVVGWSQKYLKNMQHGFAKKDQVATDVNLGTIVVAESETTDG
jgi:hypothetical protein